MTYERLEAQQSDSVLRADKYLTPHVASPAKMWVDKSFYYFGYLTKIITSICKYEVVTVSQVCGNKRLTKNKLEKENSPITKYSN